VVAAVVTTTLAFAGERRDVPPIAAFDNPCTDGDACKHHALDAFRGALAAQRAGTADHPLRVSYFGDSLTADDHITHALRTKLQALVGDGGPGFVFAAPPHPFCQHRAVVRTVSDGWHVHGISTVVPPDRLLGLGGSAECDDGGTIRFAPTGPVERVDVHYLAQPHGGTVELVADGTSITKIATAAAEKHGVFATSEVPEGTRRIELRARGRVRLFGASLEAKRGAVVDNLGVVNATAKAMRTHNLDEHWRNQLAHRGSDLVVIMYGTNEAEWLHPGVGMAEHERVFGELLDTVRTALPSASCLVVSPLDQLDYRDDKLPPRDSIPAMVAAQRRAALAHGCAFWDTYAWMGGKGASRTWFKRGLMVKDFQHPTSEGAERIADALYAGLVR
jgi:lysophospholipase L1-like esterase